jgi:putative ABC transport system substrate-binding protein
VVGGLAGLGVSAGALVAFGVRTGVLPGQSAVPTVAHVGVMGGAANNPDNLAWLRNGLSNHGWVEGQNLVLLVRNPEPPSADPSAYVDVVQDLARLGVDVIRVGSTPATQAALQVTQQIPIVFNMDDPVGRGVVQSLAHPGGNATGARDLSSSGLIAKRLGLLIELIPQLNRVALITNLDNPNAGEGVSTLQAAAAALGVQVQVFDVRAADDLEPAFVAMAAWPADGVLEWVTVPFNTNKERVGQLAVQHRLPVMTGSTNYHAAGLLGVYAPDSAEIYQEITPRKVNEILRGPGQATCRSNCRHASTMCSASPRSSSSAWGPLNGRSLRSLNGLIEVAGLDTRLGRRAGVGGLAGLGISTAGLSVLDGCSLLSSARAPASQPRVGYVGDPPESPGVAGLWDGLRELGWVEGQSLQVERRSDVGLSQSELSSVVAELVDRRVDVLVTVDTLAAKQATVTIPIVFTNLGDPVGVGAVTNLARPGGNVTGVSTGASGQFWAKRVELLKDFCARARAPALSPQPRGRHRTHRANGRGGPGSGERPRPAGPDRRCRGRSRNCLRRRGKLARPRARRRVGRRHPRGAGPHRAARGPESPPGHFRLHRVCRSRRAHVVRDQQPGHVSACSAVRRQDPAWRQARWPAG